MIDNYNDLTIEKYLEVKEILEYGFDEYETQVKLISVLADLDEDAVGNLSLVGFKRYNQKLEFLLNEPPKRMVADKYKLGGYEFNTMTNIQDMTVSQFIDYQTFVKDPDRYLVELLSVFLIPKGKKYNDGYDIIDVQRVIRSNISIVDAMSLSAFFLLLYQSLTKAILTSLTKKLKRMKRKMKTQEEIQKMETAIANLEESGAGLHSLIG